MKKLIQVWALALLAACGGEDVPSCQVAIDHFYNVSNCRLLDTNGAEFPRLEVIQNCKELLAAAPPQCEDDLANLRACFGSVPANASNDQCTSCSDEQDALFTCE